MLQSPTGMKPLLAVLRTACCNTHYAPLVGCFGCKLNIVISDLAAAQQPSQGYTLGRFLQAWLDRHQCAVTLFRIVPDPLYSLIPDGKT